MTKPNHVVLSILLAILSLAMYAQQPEFGLASFYDDSFQGSLTAYNVKYNKSDLTTSHKTYPYGTKLRVTRLENKKSVIVTVIDKGPYMKGRIVDLSRRAAQDLDMIDAGIAEVKVELYQKASKTEEAPTTTIANNTTKPKTSKDIPESFDKDTRTTANPPSRPVSTTPSTPKATIKPTSTTKTTASTTKVASTTKDKTTQKGAAPARLVKQDYKEYGLYKIQLERPVKKGYGVQVASLTNYESVMKQIADLQTKSFTNILVSAEKGTKSKPVYKVILGPQDTEAAAASYKASLKKRYKISGFVVNLEELTY